MSGPRAPRSAAYLARRRAARALAKANRPPVAKPVIHHAPAYAMPPVVFTCGVRESEPGRPMARGTRQARGVTCVTCLERLAERRARAIRGALARERMDRWAAGKRGATA